jgi:hypothetical protein
VPDAAGGVPYRGTNRAGHLRGGSTHLVLRDFKWPIGWIEPARIAEEGLVSLPTYGSHDRRDPALGRRVSRACRGQQRSNRTLVCRFNDFQHRTDTPENPESRIVTS